MSRPRIDQILSGFADGDAISHQARIMRDVFRSWGHEADLYAPMEHVSPTVRHECRELATYHGGSGDIVFHHYAIQSPSLDVFLHCAATRIMVYHNITPAAFFRGFDDGLVGQLTAAREKLGRAAAHCDQVWAVSEFNASELTALGSQDVQVFPLLFDPEPLNRPPHREVEKRLAARLDTILTVGRIAPNKKLETLIEAYHWYYRTVNPYSRLVIIGSERSCPKYFSMLNMLVADLDLPNVCFEGFASPEALPTYYRHADLFVTTSEHEGYCLPLIEAMHMQVPVIAPHLGGMPEALGKAGVQYQNVSPIELASLFEWVLSEERIREQVLASQTKRMNEIRSRNHEEELRSLLASCLDGKG